ncbi:MAG: 1-acyl-sn-glycerol-3-phosphate acyltransferase [Alphaproteobacteria bacterium]|nr:1-acyl-sn-glycerol-3-phosphate acyltransferase [Alphaproteobacteria bacterium]MCB9796871.1 1-acyl-sn-glycerol-3-phosphate acyltransferase [Alphaproteobacteria bacterium]
MRLLSFIAGVTGFLLSVVFSSVFLLFAAPFILVPRGRRERYVWWTNAAASWMILKFALWAKLDVRGRENIPYGKPYLVVANHRSWVDVLTLIWSSRAEGISKLEVFFMPVMGQLGYLGGAVFFSRSRKDSRHRAKEEALQLLRMGVPLHVYPEGTRTRDGKLREKVHLGMLEACWEIGVPLVPCGLWGTDEVIPVSPPVVNLGRTVRARYGAPVRPEDFEDAESFARAGWAEVVGLVGALEREYGA